MPRTIDITLPDLTGKLAVVTGASDGESEPSSPVAWPVPAPS